MARRLGFIPRPLPHNINPKGTRCITIQIPDDDEWEQQLYDAISRELSITWNVWEKDIGKNGTKVAKRWRKALDTFHHHKCNEIKSVAEGFIDDMPFFRQVCENDICYLEFECCPGEWVRLGRADQIPPTGQQGNGAPQPKPGGGTQQYCATLQANSKYLVPTVVNSGDTIVIQSSGAGNDGGEIQWRCPDGSTYFAGLCNSSETETKPTDPLPTINHMALILNINGTFYPFVSGSFTVPSGISNGQAYIQVNDSDITNNAGSYQICVTVTNNQAATWCKTLDFTLNSYGFVVPSGKGGQWVAGSGWETSFPPGFNDRTQLRATLNIDPCTITFIAGTYSATSIYQGDGGLVEVLNGGSVVLATVQNQGNCGSANNLDVNGSGTVTGNELLIALDTGAPAGCGLGSGVIKSITVKGTGTIPSQFGSSNC